MEELRLDERFARLVVSMGEREFFENFRCLLEFISKQAFLEADIVWAAKTMTLARKIEEYIRFMDRGVR